MLIKKIKPNLSFTLLFLSLLLLISPFSARSEQSEAIAVRIL